jgi:N utilization substance protein B
VSQVPTIPARLSIAELAETLEVEVPTVRNALAHQGESESSDSVIGADVAVAVASYLGKELAVEPRDIALESLYQDETSGVPNTTLDGRARRLVDGVNREREALDELIGSTSDHWTVARMPIIDRSILRLGLYELIHEPDVPTAVVVSEAVRLANAYSTERSGSFVNGVLATLAEQQRS